MWAVWSSRQCHAQVLDDHLADAAVRRVRPSEEPRPSHVGWVIHEPAFWGKWG